MYKKDTGSSLQNEIDMSTGKPQHHLIQPASVHLVHPADHTPLSPGLNRIQTMGMSAFPQCLLHSLCNVFDPQRA